MSAMASFKFQMSSGMLDSYKACTLVQLLGSMLILGLLPVFKWCL